MANSSYSMAPARLGLAFVCLLALAACSLSAQCRNEFDQPVDWYIAIRIPATRQYSILDNYSSSFRTAGEELMKLLVDQLSATRGHILLWNDQIGGKSSSSPQAHSKGILQSGEPGEKSLYFVHSIPEFVTYKEGNFEWKARESSQYGQSMICLTLNTQEEVNTVIMHLQAQKSTFYLDTFRQNFAGPANAKMIVNKLPYGFRLVTKTSISRQHVFEEMMTYVFNSGWLMNTWGRPYKASNCGGLYPVSNIKIRNLNGIISKDTQDHSKWAISTTPGVNTVCIGDLNHMDSQASRGGSFVCKQDAQLHRLFLSIIEHDECGLALKLKLQ